MESEHGSGEVTGRKACFQLVSDSPVPIRPSGSLLMLVFLDGRFPDVIVGRYTGAKNVEHACVPPFPPPFMYLLVELWFLMSVNLFLAPP